MTLPQALAQYGYLAIFISSVLEGESVLILAGFLVHPGYLSLPPVILTAFVGGSLGDQTCFLVGRRYGPLLLLRWPRLAAHKHRIDRLIYLHQIPLIVGVRFLYGARIAGPILIGMSGIPILRFSAFNMLGAAIWAILIAGAGYFFGQTLEWVFADLKHYEGGLLLTLVDGRWR